MTIQEVKNDKKNKVIRPFTVDEEKYQTFKELCHSNNVKMSEVIRKFINDFVEENTNNE
jgi:regulator of PEP synthase PpsR (kinase-PPPase family)